jgi:hypothetical protein
VELQCIGHGVGISPAAPQFMLQTMGARIPEHFGQLPAVLAPVWAGSNMP